MTLALNAALPEQFATALEDAIGTVRRNISAFGDLYPGDTTVDQHYRPRPP